MNTRPLFAYRRVRTDDAFCSGFRGDKHHAIERGETYMTPNRHVVDGGHLYGPGCKFCRRHAAQFERSEALPPLYWPRRRRLPPWFVRIAALLLAKETA